MSPAHALQRPPMPDPASQFASVHTQARVQILLEDWDDIVGEYMEEFVSKRRLTKWGPPDTSANPLSDISRQLSTPGLYGTRPQVSHPDGHEGLLGPEGLLSKAGVFTKLQHVQYMTMGCGDWYVKPKLVDGHTPYLDLVTPADLHLVPHPEMPDQAGELWHLRIRDLGTPLGWRYTWDVHSIMPGKNPSLRIHLADDFQMVNGGRAGGLGDDITKMVLEDYDPGAYDWTFEDGEPFIPYQRYTVADTGMLRNTFLRRGVHRGTLNTAMYATYAGRSALDATGSAAIAVGIEPPAGDVNRDGASDPVRSMDLEPGAILFCRPSGDGQAAVYTIGPGANLPTLQGFVSDYIARLASQYGLNGSDIQRMSSDAASGFSLMVSERGKRMVQRQVTPLFRKSDLRLVRMYAALSRVAGLEVFPESGYSISYAEIEDSPQERKDRREQTDWEVDKGFLSPVDAYMRWNPGTSREQALKAIVRAKADQARIDELVAAELGTSNPPTPNNDAGNPGEE